MSAPVLFPDMPPRWSVHFDDRNSTKHTSFYDLKEDNHPTQFYFIHNKYYNSWRLSGGDYISEKNHWPLVESGAMVVNQLRAHLLAERMGVTE